METTSWIATFFIIILSGLNASVPNLLVSVTLLAALVFQLDKDLSASRYAAPIALTVGTGISYALAIPSEIGTSAVEQTSVILPLACFITILACGTILLSQQTVQAFCRWRGEHRGAVVLIFPWLWVAAWAAFYSVHPLGRLTSWTPTHSLSNLLLPAFGLAGSDFLAALLALVPLIFFLPYHDERTPLVQAGPSRSAAGQADKSSHGISSRRHIAYAISAIAFVLVILDSNIGISHSSAVTAEPLSISCALPRPSRSAPDEPLIAMDYLHESAVLTGQGAKIVLWPENAVHLASIGDAAALHVEVGNIAVARRAFIATSYNAVLRRGSKSVIETTLVGLSETHNTSQTFFTYRKQALVPIAETYSYVAGTLPLPMGQIEMPEAGRPGHSAGVLDISAAICHDTSFPAILRQAASSQLTLVPSSVFSERIAWTRIYQLQASARSLQSAYLVCDGADEGISAFIDQQGSLQYWQKGSGSFTIRHSFAPKEGQTLYARAGEFGALVILLAIVLGLMGLEELADKGIHSFRGMLGDVKHTLQNKLHDLLGLGRTRSSRRDHERDLLD